MKNQHTPGPWKVAGNSIVTENDTHCIAVIEDDGGYEAPHDQRDANAQLISAAPELLEACEWSLGSIDAERFPNSHAGLIKAIAKAKGEL